MLRPLAATFLLSFVVATTSISAQTPEDLQRMRAAAEAGNPRDQFILGRMLEKSDPSEATRWYRKAAEQGQRNAQTSLGFAYLEGRGGVAKDDAEAARWYRKAADQGEQLAQWQLAWMSQEGRGVPASDEEALKWYEAVIATDAADGESGRHPMTEMAKPAIGDIYSRRAELYEVGVGTPKDPGLGYYWLSRAAELDPELYAEHLTDRAKSLSAEQRADAEHRILEWAAAKGHSGPEAFAPALAALHAAAKVPQVPDPKKDHLPR